MPVMIQGRRQLNECTPVANADTEVIGQIAHSTIDTFLLIPFASLNTKGKKCRQCSRNSANVQATSKKGRRGIMVWQRKPHHGAQLLRHQARFPSLPTCLQNPAQLFLGRSICSSSIRHPSLQRYSWTEGKELYGRTHWHEGTDGTCTASLHKVP